LYDKEAVFEYIVQKKTENVRKMKEYEKAKRKEETELEELAKLQEEAKAESFSKLEKGIVNPSSFKSDKSGTVGSEISISNMAMGRDKKLASFWVPSMTSNLKPSKSLSPPDQKVYCPMSGKPLRAKDLIPVNFTPIDKNLSREELISKKVRIKFIFFIFYKFHLATFKGKICLSGHWRCS
jgi:nitric oxide synthase-interacting protein